MAEKKSYSELLKDPRWQKKRLEILERDEFACTSCGDNSQTLNVHHRVPYRKNTMPWEYENDELITFCEKCHNDISEKINYCTAVIMGRCWCSDSAEEVYKIMSLIDGMDPLSLRSVWKIIEDAKNID